MSNSEKSFLEVLKKINKEHEERDKQSYERIKENIKDFVMNPHKYSHYEEPVDLNGKLLYPDK